jgi:hypothetical protein
VQRGLVTPSRSKLTWVLRDFAYLAIDASGPRLRQRRTVVPSGNSTPSATMPVPEISVTSTSRMG